MKNVQKHTSIGNLVEVVNMGMVEVTSAELYYKQTE